MKREFAVLIALWFGMSVAMAQRVIPFCGTITNSYNQPVENVLVTCRTNDAVTFSNDKGFFEINVPAQSNVEILFRHVSYFDSIIHINISAKTDTLFTMVMRSAGKQLTEVQIVETYNDSYTRIDPKLSFKLPSPTGGVESLIKTMPGTSSVNELSSQYNVRGGNYDENLIFVNDIQIYRPFLVRSAQQEGLSFVNLDLTRNVKFSAGGFEAKYGDKMSSVLDVEYKTPKKYGGSFTASFLGATAHVEGNVNDKFTFLVGVRYKSNSYLLKSMETKGSYKPRFFDTQMLLTWKLSPKWDLDLLANLSRNKYQYIPEDRETNFGTFESSRRLTIYFDGQEVDQYESYLGGLTLSFHPNDRDLYKLIVSSYYASEKETYDLQSQYWLSDIEADLSSSSDDIAQVTSVRGVGTFLEHTRNYLNAIVSAADVRGRHGFPKNVIEWGFKVQNEIINDKIKEWELMDSSGYTLPFVYTEPGTAVAFDDPSRLLTFGSFFIADNQINTYRLTGFVQSNWTIDKEAKFILNSGLRLHYWTFNNELTASPRFILNYVPQWKHDWTFRLKAGSYYQPPFYREMRAQDGTLNPNIRSQHSYQLALASDFDFKMWKRPFKLTMEAYYKYMTNLISYSVDNVKIVYSAENDAKGYATGLDVKLSGEFIAGIESWISFSLMKTEEDLLNDYYYDEAGNRIEPGYIPRPADQRFSINLFFQDQIPFYTPIRVHLNFVFASGLPYGAPNAERYQQILRAPWYRRVDVGFSYMFLEQSRDRMKHKSKFFRSIKNAGIFFEVFNILGINNVSSYLWVTDINNVMTAVPNYLTPRLLNLKLAVEF
ncbi:MAG: TonB-dependent receptor plug domain-containing protein [Bacteroidales bacterium]|nr:TonB-dependent receptor plug domain-containing protein [Bacteroidales bacterium]